MHYIVAFALAFVIITPFSVRFIYAASAPADRHWYSPMYMLPGVVLGIVGAIIPGLVMGGAHHFVSVMGAG